MLVDIGGGTLPHPRANVVIDLHHPKGSPAQDASVIPWKTGDYGGPLRDGSVDELYASHFMEHVHRGQPLINVMNEAWRVLKPGGTFTVIMPLVGYTNPHSGAPESSHIGWQPWSDPTHVNYWWLPEALLYFTEGPFRPHADYGTKVWKQLGAWIPEPEATARINAQYHSQQPADTWWSVRNGWEGVACLIKP